MSGNQARSFRTEWICQVEDAQRATGAPASYVQIIKALGAHATARGEWANAYPSQKTLAVECCVSVPTIKRALAWARKHALIKREEYGNRRAGKAARYRLVLKPVEVHFALCQAEWEAQEEHRAHITAVRRAAVAARWQPHEVLGDTVASDDMQICHLNHEGLEDTVVSDDIQICPVNHEVLGITVVSDDIQTRSLKHEVLGITVEPPITTKGVAAAAELHAADPVHSIDEVIAELACVGTARAQRLAALLEDTGKYNGGTGRSIA